MSVSRLAILCAALGLVGLHASAQPQQATSAGRGAPVQPTRGSVEHGRYLVEQVVMCYECHSTRDSGSIILDDTRFMGGPVPVRPSWPNEWAVRTPRIKGLPGYTDALGIRLLTQGAQGRDGVQLRPPMPRFRMTPQDAADVVTYLKALP